MANGRLPTEESGASRTGRAGADGAHLGRAGRGGAREADRRRRRPQAASLSLFEWALSVEQEREEDLVGAGR